MISITQYLEEQSDDEYLEEKIKLKGLKTSFNKNTKKFKKIAAKRIKKLKKEYPKLASMTTKTLDKLGHEGRMTRFKLGNKFDKWAEKRRQSNPEYQKKMRIYRAAEKKVSNRLKPQNVKVVNFKKTVKQKAKQKQTNNKSPIIHKNTLSADAYNN